MNRIKCLIIVTFLPINIYLFISKVYPAKITTTENFVSRHREESSYRGIGGADLALDPWLPSNLYLSEDPWGLRILFADMSFSPPEMAKISKTPNLLAYSGAHKKKYLTFDKKLAQFLNITNRFNLDSRGYIDIFRFYYRLDNGHSTFSGGIFYEAEAMLKFNAPHKLTQRSYTLTKKEQYLDLEDDRKLLLSGFRADNGGHLSWTETIPLAAGAVHIGGRARAYSREYMPLYRIHVNRYVDNQKDIESKDSKIRKGEGTAIDGYSTWQSGEPFFNTTFSVMAENIVNQTKFGNGDILKERTRYGTGFAIQPLYGTIFSPWHIAGDVEDFQYGIPGIQLGTFYIITITRGSKLTPQIGISINQWDLVGGRSELFTLGLKHESGILTINILSETNVSAKTYNNGVGVEWKF